MGGLFRLGDCSLNRLWLLTRGWIRIRGGLHPDACPAYVSLYRVILKGTDTTRKPDPGWYQARDSLRRMGNRRPQGFVWTKENPAAWAGLPLYRLLPVLPLLSWPESGGYRLVTVLIITVHSPVCGTYPRLPDGG